MKILNLLKKCAGVTLVELLITLSLLAVLGFVTSSVVTASLRAQQRVNEISADTTQIQRVMTRLTEELKYSTNYLPSEDHSRLDYTDTDGNICSLALSETGDILLTRGDAESVQLNSPNGTPINNLQFEYDTNDINQETIIIALSLRNPRTGEITLDSTTVHGLGN